MMPDDETPQAIGGSAGDKETPQAAGDSAGNPRPAFLAFPSEIRNMIYRFLLRHHKPIGDSPPVRLGTQILRTCSQIRDEALPILYGENTWEIRVYAKDGQACCSAVATQDLGSQKGPLFHPNHIHHLRRLQISIADAPYQDIERIPNAIPGLCEALSTSEIPKLDYLHIEVGGLSCKSHYIPIFDKFTRLPCFRNVYFTNVGPSSYGKLLMRRITQRRPPSSIRRMYESFVTFARPYSFCRDYIRGAARAVARGDVEALMEEMKRANYYVQRRELESEYHEPDFYGSEGDSEGDPDDHAYQDWSAYATLDFLAGQGTDDSVGADGSWRT